jgi:holliday junction resolvase YEN1
MYFVLHLLQLGVELHFVFDGHRRPPKRGKVWRGTHNKSTDLLRQTLDKLGVASHVAIGEAEADCAEMEKQGIVDAVWTDDGDAFMFGASTLIRFHHEVKNGSPVKSKTQFRIYRSEDIAKRIPGLDREGFVLYAILNGGDYDKAGLKGFGMSNSLKAVEKGLGKALCEASETGLAEWREELIEYLKEIQSKIVVPPTFPDFQHLRDYRQPLVSDFRNFEWKEPPVFEGELKPFLQEFFNFQAEKYMKWIVPTLLIRTLMRTTPGQEYNNDRYQIKIGKQGDSATTKMTFLLSAATSLDMTQYAKTDGSCYDLDFRVACEETPSWVLTRGAPDALDAFVAGDIGQAAKRKPVKPRKAQVSQHASPVVPFTKSKPSVTGKKRGRPPKEKKEDKSHENKKFRPLEEMNVDTSSEKFSIRRESSSTTTTTKKVLNSPQSSKSTVFGQKTDPINLVSSDDEADKPKSIAKPNAKPNQTTSIPLPAAFIRYDLDLDFGSD